MKKTVIRSSSNLENALERDALPYWYVVVKDPDNPPDTCAENPWTRDIADSEKKMYLMDDCVIVIRPARYSENDDDQGIYEKGRYFLEISNQDSSTILSSAQVFTWDEVNKLAFFFKDISFTAATRVWKSKHLS